MGSLRRHRPVKLIASIIFRDKELCLGAEKELERIFGPLEQLRFMLKFDRTGYYSEEMGEELERELICFKKLIEVENIEKTKLLTNEIEVKFSADDKRRVNIDPGYITDAKLVLLTTKDYSHRVHIGGRIFAESTLHFRNGSFNPWPWTYPDYASSEIIDYFNKVRELYVSDIRSQAVK